jgi:hypothetical protein
MLEPGSLKVLCAFLREDHVAVLAAQTDRPLALGVDERDDFLVDGAGEHHLDDFHRALVGNAQPALELALDPEVLEHRGDLRPAAMHHDRVDARLLEQRDVAGKGAAQFQVAHGMAAVLHDDRLALVALHIGQRLRQDGGVAGKALESRHGAFRVHCRRSPIAH